MRKGSTHGETKNSFLCYEDELDLSFLYRDGKALEAGLDQRLRISHLSTNFVTKRMSNRMPYPERNEVRSEQHVNIGKKRDPDEQG